jgi:hypothetical protein
MPAALLRLSTCFLHQRCTLCNQDYQPGSSVGSVMYKLVNDFTTAISSQGNTMTATECWIRPESTLVRIMYIMLNMVGLLLSS